MKGVPCDASEAQKLHRLQLGHIRQNIEHPGNLLKKGNLLQKCKATNEGILLCNTPQNGQVMTNELEDDIQKQFTAKKALFDFLPNMEILKFDRTTLA